MHENLFMKKSNADPSRFRQADRSTPDELGYRGEMDHYIQNSIGSYYEKIENFPKYIPRQALSRFIALFEIFQKAFFVQGDIIECGVNLGGCLMYFAQLSSILEPVNLQRRVVGFDTFSGFAAINDKDKSVGSHNSEMKKGGYSADSYDDLLRSVELYDKNRFLGHINKVSLIKGDACKTIPRFIAENTHTMVSLLHLDFDLYEPTKVAIENFVPRMPKGGVIIFDELNNDSWPGETVAVMESLGLGNLRIARLPYEPHISYAILE